MRCGDMLVISRVYIGELGNRIILILHSIECSISMVYMYRLGGFHHVGF